jgi:hypothetical protein
MNDTEKREFERFNQIAEKLTRAFEEGYNHPQSQELGFYVAQAIRDVPELFRMLDDFEAHSNDEILDAIHAVVSNHFSLSEANRLLTSVSDGGEIQRDAGSDNI